LSIFGGEMIGTAILVLLGDGVVAAVLLAKSKAENGGWIVITFGWGFAVMAGAYAVGQFTGGSLNPAVTIGLWINGNIQGHSVPGYILGEMAGAMLGAFLVYLTYYLHWRETEDPGAKLAVFCTGPAIRNYLWNFITEVVGTCMLVFGILAITAKGNGFGIGPALTNMGTLLVAFLVVGIGLSLGGPTGYAINPARDLGPRIMHAILPIPGKGGSDWSYSWVPVLGPLVGGAIGALLFGAFYPG
jgi:glycerol uptake facilitator protein